MDFFFFFFFIFIPESVHAIAIVVVVIFAILIYAFSTGKKLEKKFKNTISLRFIRVINVKFEEVKINPKKKRHAVLRILDKLKI